MGIDTGNMDSSDCINADSVI